MLFIVYVGWCLYNWISILQKHQIPLNIYKCLFENAEREARSSVFPHIKTDHFAIVSNYVVSFRFKFHIIIRQFCFQSGFNRNRQHWWDFILYRLSHRNSSNLEFIIDKQNREKMRRFFSSIVNEKYSTVNR